MKAATKRQPRAPKGAKVKTVDLRRLSDREIDALPEDVFIASLKPHARRIMLTSIPLRGAFKK